MTSVKPAAPAIPPITPEAQVFLDAILADPENDAPRLEYAAYLRKKGDPRGDFIEVQCALAKHPTRSERIQGKKRVAALLRQNRRTWEARLFRTGIRAEFRRGFIDEIRSYSIKRAADRLPGLFATEPIRKLTLYAEGEADVKKLIEWGAMSRLRSLHLYGIGSKKLINVLARSLQSSFLKSITLRFRDIDAKTIKTFATSPVFAHLERLNLTGSGLTDEDLITLLDASPAFRLKALYLSRCKLSTAGLKALLAHPMAERLSILCLNHNEDIDNEGFAALAKAPCAEHLTFLELMGTKLGARGARALAASPHLTKLTSLRVRGTPASVRGNAGGIALKARWGGKIVNGVKDPSG